MSRKTTRPSRLSMSTRMKQLEAETEELRDALETIADVLEDVGILDADEEIENVRSGEDDPNNLNEIGEDDLPEGEK